MKTKLLFLMLGTSMFLTAQQPVAPVKVVTDEYFGQKVDDPYRYMEDLQSPEVSSWFKEQGQYARNVLDKISGRTELIEQFKKYDSRKSSRIYNVSITENDYYFYLKQTPVDENGKLFYRMGYEGEEHLLFDPEEYDKNSGKKYSIGDISPNVDGSLVSFTVSPNGSESSTLMIMSREDKKMFPEKIDRCWFPTVSWLPNNESFTYNRLKSSDVHDMERELNSKVYFHKVGTDPNKDIEIFSNEINKDLNIQPEDFPLVFYDKNSKKFLAGAFTVERDLRLFIADYVELPAGKIEWTKLTETKDKIVNFFPDEEYIYFDSKKDAPNHMIIRVPVDNPDIKKAVVVVPENPNEVLDGFTVTKKGLYYTTTQNGVVARVYRKDHGSASAIELDLPFEAGSANVSSKSVNFDDIWVTINGWTKDYTRYRYDPVKNDFKYETMSSKADFPEFENLVVEEIMIKSHDGVMVPLSLIYNKGIKKDGSNPLFIYGYGSYGASMNPFFYPNYLEWTRQGGVLAIAHVRGGGELGDEWYKAGYKKTKPNTWKDLIACTEYLHNNNFSRPDKTMIQAGSAGGILVGRAMTDRPDLFGVVIPQVGCMNTLRGEFSPNGPGNIPEFGTVEIEEEFLALKEMDSYHHVKDGVKYPATLITAGMNDPRVIAWQPGKFAARLQASNGSDKPVLFRVDYESGHGQGDSKSKQFEKNADSFSFALWQMGHPDYQSIKQKEKPVD